MTAGTTTNRVQGCLNRIRAGDAAAHNELLRISQDRLRELTAKMLARIPEVHRWEDTDDVLQGVLLRLDHLLAQVPVVSALEFLRLAATNIRWVLLDLLRHYQGPRGLASNYVTPQPQKGGSRVMACRQRGGPETAREVLSLDEWSAFHEIAGNLPEDERAVFDLLWYHDLKQDEAAEALGISISTLKRRWQSARLILTEKLVECGPD